MVNSGRFPAEPPDEKEGTIIVEGSRTKKQKRFLVSTRPGRGTWFARSSHRFYWIARLEALGWEDAGVPVQITDTKTGEILSRTGEDDV